MQVNDPQWLAGHKLVDPFGVEIESGIEAEGMLFHAITRAPGDGTGTNGKILATLRNGWRSEFYPPTGYRIVPREGFDADAYYASH